MPDSATALGWTCERCEVTVSWMPDVERPPMPASWIDVDGGLHCLNCRRELAADAGLDGMPEDTPAGERQKLSSHARIEFEIQRDPERARQPDRQVLPHLGHRGPQGARCASALPPGP